MKARRRWRVGGKKGSVRKFLRASLTRKDKEEMCLEKRLAYIALHFNNNSTPVIKVNESES